MTICHLPPGRGSSSQVALAKVCGPHQAAMCLGSVQAWNTSARGASKMREVTNSRSDRSTASFAAVISLLFTATFLLLLLKLAKVFFQAIEPLFPEPAILLEPVGRPL